MLRILVITLAILAAAPALADGHTVRDRVVGELIEDGYTEIRISRTILRRLRFVGENQETRREIVVHPVTGVVLRDYTWVLSGMLEEEPKEKKSRPSIDDDDDDEYDEYDDDEYDDDDYEEGDDD